MERRRGDVEEIEFGAPRADADVAGRRRFANSPHPRNSPPKNVAFNNIMQGDNHRLVIKRGVFPEIRGEGFNFRVRLRRVGALVPQSGGNSGIGKHSVWIERVIHAAELERNQALSRMRQTEQPSALRREVRLSSAATAGGFIIVEMAIIRGRADF